MGFMKLPPRLKESMMKLPIRRSEDFLAVDLSGEFVKFVHAKDLAGKMVIENIKSKKIPEGSEEEIIRFLDGARQDFGVSSHRAVCIIPSKLFISRNIDMPSNNREEIAKIINLQVGRFTPYSRDEIVIDYLCREMPGQHYTNVLLLIVNRKVVERIYQILEAANLFIDKIAIASEGLILVDPLLGEAADDSEAVGVVHLGETNSDLTIKDQNQLVFVRSIPVGAQHFRSDSDEATSNFVSELTRSISAYQDEGIGNTVKTYLITGIMDGLSFLESAIRTGIPAVESAKAAVKIVDYKKCFEFSEQVIREMDAEHHVSYLELLAAITNSTKLKLDLIPKEVKLKRRVREGGREMLTLGILIMTLFLMVSFLLVIKIYVKSIQIEKLDTINASTFEEARSLERVSTKSRAVRKLLANRGRGLYVFDKVTALIGEDIYLNQFKFDTEGNLALKGTADSMSRVFAFVSQLEESNYFTSVKTNETKSRRQGKKEVADFDIECVLAEGF